MLGAVELVVHRDDPVGVVHPVDPRVEAQRAAAAHHLDLVVGAHDVAPDSEPIGRDPGDLDRAVARGVEAGDLVALDLRHRRALEDDMAVDGAVVGEHGEEPGVVVDGRAGGRRGRRVAVVGAARAVEAGVGHAERTGDARLERRFERHAAQALDQPARDHEPDAPVMELGAGRGRGIVAGGDRADTRASVVLGSPSHGADGNPLRCDSNCRTVIAALAPSNPGGGAPPGHRARASPRRRRS